MPFRSAGASGEVGLRAKVPCNATERLVRSRWRANDQRPRRKAYFTAE